MLGPVQDIGLGGLGVVGGDELLLHHVLGLLHGGDLLPLLQLRHHRAGQLVQLLVAHFLGGVAHIGLKDSPPDLGGVEGDFFPASLHDHLQHGKFLFLCDSLGPSPTGLLLFRVNAFYYRPFPRSCQSIYSVFLLIFCASNAKYIGPRHGFTPRRGPGKLDFI